MPIKIPDNLPSAEILSRENIFVMPESRAFQQDIRPLRIVILNLMPDKESTETQLLRLLGNTPLQLEITLLRMATHASKNTSDDYLEQFYKTFSDIKKLYFDGMIITGAPVEKMEFDEVNYWPELQSILDWQVKHVTSTLYICWGAQAGLYHHYGIPKYNLDCKLSGVYSHSINKKSPHWFKLLRGFDDEFFIPHSRYTEVREEDVAQISDLEILSKSDKAGVYLVASRDGRHIFATGHAEYDANTLKNEYERDVAKGLDIKMPENYFPDNDPTKPPVKQWRSHGYLLFANWLNYYVYQETPFDLPEDPAFGR